MRKRKGSLCWSKQNNKWKARIRLDGVIHYLGVYADEREAEKVIKSAIYDYEHGHFIPPIKLYKERLKREADSKQQLVKVKRLQAKVKKLDDLVAKREADISKKLNKLNALIACSDGSLKCLRSISKARQAYELALLE